MQLWGCSNKTLYARRTGRMGRNFMTCESTAYEIDIFHEIPVLFRMIPS